MTRRPLPETPPGAPVPAEMTRPTRCAPARLVRVLDALAFSNALPAAIAAGLSLASSRALEAPSAGLFALIAASGAFVVYGLDRLRDTRRDRATSPLRTEFVERHRRRFRVSIGVSAGVLVAAISVAPPRAGVLCVAVGAIGLLHRRLKGWLAAKVVYVSAAWVAICAGIPALVAGFGPRAAWLAAILFASFGANLIASNLRDDELQLLSSRPEAVLRIARALAMAGVAIAGFAPAELRSLVWIPLAETIALVFFRPSEHYGQLAVDGALLAGALVCLGHQGLA